MGTFDGLSVALSALQAQRRMLDVAGQNIANVNTPGYTRQRVNLQAVGASTIKGVWTGSSNSLGGVQAVGIERLRDAFLEVRGQAAHGAQGEADATQGVLAQIEQMFPEPSSDGLGEQLSQLWSAFQDVANQPADIGTRTALLQRASAVSDWLNAAAQQLTTLSVGAASEARSRVDEVNSLAQQVADLNLAIGDAQHSGLSFNDLADKRDLLTLRLADLVGGQAGIGPDGAARVMIGGTPLVAGTTVRPMQLTGGGATLQLTWAQDGSAVQLTGGEVKGLVSAVAGAIPSWSARLDAVASTLAAQTNAVHSAAYDLDGNLGGPLFSGTTAATIGVAVTDPRKVAASQVAPGPGGPSLNAGAAQAMAAQGAAPAGADVVYRGLVGDLGLAVAHAASSSATQQAVTDSIDTARESGAGVDIDEEMANVVQYQRSYEAAARVLTAVDAVLDQLINRTGLVGRQ
jgi:flagellar hook-associated protein 1 FlgK